MNIFEMDNDQNINEIRFLSFKYVSDGLYSKGTKVFSFQAFSDIYHQPCHVVFADIVYVQKK